MVWLMYLRKSRQDDPNETVEEVLAKHETQLQEWAERELGHRIPAADIYREVISAESIDDREEVKKVLARIEDPAVAGVLVKDPQRLSRGDLEDCGRLINSLRFTHTLVATPIMTYDLERKMERRFFQDELLRGRDYYEYAREVMWQGRVAAHKRGCFLGNHAPYGYDKVKKGKDYTLEPNENADVVRMIFDLYANKGMTPGCIAQQLTKMEIKPPRSDQWHKDTVRKMLRNVHYNGQVAFNQVKITPVLEFGEIKKKRLAQPDDEIILAPGKHDAIIDPGTWKRAQERIAVNPRVNHNKALRNPLSGVLFCSKCGKTMHVHPYKTAQDRFECRQKPRCYKSVAEADVMNAVIYALENAELPALRLKVKNDDGNARKIQERLLAKLEKQLEEYQNQEETQYELLETGKYTQDLFDRRNAKLREKMTECQAAIYKAKTTMPANVDYAERVVALETAIAALKNRELTPREQNMALKAIVAKIVFTGSQSIDPAMRRGVKQGGENPFTLEFTLRL